MSYLVLARKWRPKIFSETAGQDHVLQALMNALDSGRLHHAYLFTGTRGVGKTTIARILSKALNCENGVSAEPCGKCSSCYEIDEGRFVDLIEVDAASKTKVDDTRELLDNVQYAATRGRYKVYLIDEVHMLSKSSFNALLKTLEEPPEHVKFLLATTDPQKLPATVLSRCLQFNLKRMTPKLISDRLEFICNAEEVTFEPAALSMLARAADGSMRDALSLLDQAIAFCNGNIEEALTSNMLGTINRNHVIRLIYLLASNNAKDLLDAIKEIDEQFPDYFRLLDDLARDLQRIAIFQAVGTCDSDDGFAEKEISKLAKMISISDVQLFYQISIIGRRDLSLAPDPRSGFEMTLLRMLAFRPAEAISKILSENHNEVGSTQDLQNSKTFSNNLKKKEKVEKSEKSGDAEKIENEDNAWLDPNWSKLVPDLKLSGASLLLASNCAYKRREGDKIFLILDSRSESMLTSKRKDLISASLSQHFDESLTLDIKIGITEEETPIQQESRELDKQLENARHELDKDENIQSIKSMFGADLQSESVKIISGEKE
ncbi:MAG: DNA polymerase III subunit gamma/tau [Gammaproteobacteria bacterium]|nr:DNA polymerase III subunit gamma/tau [Gammaproteobacteria bacterium]|tara:strand:+ start:1380 stop:3020 length:1641 start_codon:yes stop_codon:yes gene_type:complete